jgi:ribonucleoside-diphosphate reductase beta chain
VFAESEVRHADAYSKLLDALGLNDEFLSVPKIPAIQQRVAYLTEAIRGASKVEDADFAMVLTLFSLFVENVSLFSQFAILKSFNLHRRVLKDVDNVVQATQKEETIHALFGMRLVNEIRAERPDWFGEVFYSNLAEAARRALAAETAILDWIFEEGELDFLPKADLVEFVKHRLNESIEGIGGQAPFAVDPAAMDRLQWFTVELKSNVHGDFFHKKPTDYTKHDKPVTENDLF